ncbi:MAG: DUF952 domain-containing protein [Myxococcota bacterium]|nr:DUF952 domain-containing protein [Myxococcota bacterium]
MADSDRETGSEGSALEPIYHLAPESELEAGCRAGFYAPARLPEDGFVHCAPADLVVAIANDYLGDVPEPIWLLEIDPTRLSAEVRVEAPAPIPGGGRRHLEPGRLFPHVYGPIELEAIRRAGIFGRAPEGYVWPDRLGPFAPPSSAEAAAPRLARTRETYDRVARRFMSKTQDRTQIAPWMDRLAEALAPGARVLDAGGGPGHDLPPLRARGLRPTCADLSLGMLREGAPLHGGPRVQADLRRLPFATGAFDGIWANASLLHLDPGDLERALTELHRILRAGGCAHVAVKKGRGAGWDLERYGEPRWFQYWSADPLDARLEAAGFAIRHAEEHEGRHEPWLVRLLEK